MNSNLIKISMLALSVLSLPISIKAEPAKQEKYVTKQDLQAAIDEHHTQDALKAQEAQKAAVEAKKAADEERRRERFFNRASRER